MHKPRAFAAISDMLAVGTYCALCAVVGAALILLAPFSRPTKLPDTAPRRPRLITVNGRPVDDESPTP